MMDLLHHGLANIDAYHIGISHSLGLIQWDHIQLGQGLMPDDWVTIATKFKDTDLSGDVGGWWDKTVKSGQVWAFLLGAIFGYLFKTFTTYG